jgi:two-component system phosphate regulon sensor histidine kinase PhoR
MSIGGIGEEPDGPARDLAPAARPPGGRALAFAALVVAVAVAAIAIYAVPAVVALPTAFALLLAGFALRGGETVERRRRSIAASPSRRRPWPDVGVKAMVEAIDEPCIVVDAGGAVRWFNREAAARFPTLRRGEPLSFAIRVTVVLDAVDEVIALGRSDIVEWQDKVPTERWSRGHFAPLHLPPAVGDADRRPDFVVVRIEDLTEGRRLEKMRADFVANASHELRTPLAAVSGFIETLQGPARDDAEARRRFLAVMAEQAGRMRRLIDDLLSLSRVEMRAHLRPEARVDLCDVLAHVVDLVGPAARAGSAEIVLAGCDRPLAVRGDRDELVQVFTNLVENAVKYGGEGGRVDVAARLEGAAVVTSVRDHGPGIDPVHLPRLTERFYRAHAETSGAKRGTGLGLAIVKHIVTRHGGRLEISSRLGEGSVFTVALDRWPADEGQENQRVEPSSK